LRKSFDEAGGNSGLVDSLKVEAVAVEVIEDLSEAVTSGFEVVSSNFEAVSDNFEMDSGDFEVASAVNSGGIGLIWVVFVRSFDDFSLRVDSNSLLARFIGAEACFISNYFPILDLVGFSSFVLCCKVVVFISDGSTEVSVFFGASVPRS
jgi:hypothetical protein